MHRADDGADRVRVGILRDTVAQVEDVRGRRETAPKDVVNGGRPHRLGSEQERRIEIPCNGSGASRRRIASSSGTR